jgi:hypothetical protein
VTDARESPTQPMWLWGFLTYDFVTLDSFYGTRQPLRCPIKYYTLKCDSVRG